MRPSAAIISAVVPVVPWSIARTCFIEVSARRKGTTIVPTSERSASLMIWFVQEAYLRLPAGGCRRVGSRLRAGCSCAFEYAQWAEKGDEAERTPAAPLRAYQTARPEPTADQPTVLGR